MKYRSISFSAPMVRANRDDHKRCTRRIMKPQPPKDCGKIITWWYRPAKVDRHGEEYAGDKIFGAFSEDGEWGIKSPFVPGEVRWVREAYRALAIYDHLPPREIPVGTSVWPEAYRYEVDLDMRPLYGKLRPAMFMPRWMARDWVRITDVRAERVQDITEEDAKQEGVAPWDGCSDQPMTSGELMGACPYRAGFAILWDEIHGDQDEKWWKRNPWVWVVTYSRCEKPEDA